MKFKLFAVFGLSTVHFRQRQPGMSALMDTAICSLTNVSRVLNRSTIWSRQTRGGWSSPLYAACKVRMVSSIDGIVEKPYTIELICWHSCQGRMVKGINFITLCTRWARSRCGDHPRPNRH